MEVFHPGLPVCRISAGLHRFAAGMTFTFVLTYHTGRLPFFHWCLLCTALGLNDVWRACLFGDNWHLIEHLRRAYARDARRSKMDITMCNSRNLVSQQGTLSMSAYRLPEE